MKKGVINSMVQMFRKKDSADPDVEDLEAVKKVEKETRPAGKTFKYEIGQGTYSYQEELKPLNIFQLILEEMDLQLEMEYSSGDCDMGPTDYQSLRASLDLAIKEFSKTIDQRDAINGVF